jgi:SAM-dependent methyltransferase
MSSTDDDLWERHADWWIERFTDGVDPEYEDQILPIADSELAGFTRVLDLGCGDGQVGRRIAASGSAVVGVDPTWNQLTVAAQRAGGPAYLRATASSLPFASECFDAVVACLVFEHIDDLVGAIGEVARVLRDEGRFSLFLNHPLLQTPGSGWIEDHTVDPPEGYWRLGPYLVAATSEEEVERGVVIPFVHRPISHYLNALAERRLVLERMVEPGPPESFVARAPEYAASQHIPRLMYLRLRKTRH